MRSRLAIISMVLLGLGGLVGCGRSEQIETAPPPQQSNESVSPAATAPAPDPAAESPRRPLHGDPVEVTGYHIGDTVQQTAQDPTDEWVTKDGQLLAEFVPDWIPASDDSHVVVGYVKPIEMYTPSDNPLSIYDEDGRQIGHFESGGPQIGIGG
jgi:hypothetical protein